MRTTRRNPTLTRFSATCFFPPLMNLIISPDAHNVLVTIVVLEDARLPNRVDGSTKSRNVDEGFRNGIQDTRRDTNINMMLACEAMFSVNVSPHAQPLVWRLSTPHMKIVTLRSNRTSAFRSVSYQAILYNAPTSFASRNTPFNCISCPLTVITM